MRNLIVLTTLALAGFLPVQGVSAAESKAELGGYCPVAYFKADKPVKGSADHAASHDGKTYYLVNADAKALFEKSPEKFLPQYAGHCAYGMALGKKFESDPTVYLVVDDKLYLNKNAEVGKKFREDANGFIAQADAEWAKMN